MTGPGPLNIVHGAGLPPEMIKELVGAGVTFTATPENELGQGHVTRMAKHLLAAGAAPSLGTDTEVVTAGEVLTAARVMLAVQRDVAITQFSPDSWRGAVTMSYPVQGDPRLRSSAAGQGWSPTRAIARVSGTPSISRLVIVAARAPRVPFDRSLSAMANTAP